MPKLTLIPASGDNAATLLKAAGQLFRKKGFAATTVREIAELAGVWPGSLHYHFPTKESILLALMERGIETAEAGFREAISTSDDPVERIRLAMKAHIRMLVGDDDGTYVLLYEGRGLEGDARASMVRLRDRYDAMWEGLLYQAVGTSRLKPGLDLKLVRLSILGSINWVAQWFSTEGGQTAEEIGDHFAETLLGGLLSNRTEDSGLSNSRLPLEPRQPSNSTES